MMVVDRVLAKLRTERAELETGTDIWGHAKSTLCAERRLLELPRYERIAQAIIWGCVDEYGDTYVTPLAQHIRDIERRAIAKGAVTGGGLVAFVAWWLL